MTRRMPLALGLVSLFLPGCLSFVNPCSKPLAEDRDLCKQLPISSCQNVYVILVNGIDPFQCANLQGVRDYLANLGFVKSYYAQLYHESCLIKELVEVQREHPDARFVVVGFEHGAVTARNLADHASESGLQVDMLVFLQPKGIGGQSDATSPSCQVLTIRAQEQSNPEQLESDVMEVPCWSRYGVPTHPQTLKQLGTILFELAAQIPTVGAAYEAFPTILDDPAPTPRPIKFANEDRVDDWDFLKPVSSLKNQTAFDSSAELQPLKNHE